MPYRYEGDFQNEYGKLNKRVGSNIRRARRDMGWTQEELAIKLQRSPGWVSFIESGTNGANLFDLIRIANLTDRPLEYFVSGSTLEHGRGPVPETREDWMALYPSEPLRAEMHANVDELYRRGVAGPTPSGVK